MALTPPPSPPQLPGQSYGGFADRALHAVPGWALGFIGTFIAIAIALFIVVKLGGLDSAVQRIAGAYATRIENSVTELTGQVDRLEQLTSEVRGTTKKLESIEQRLVEMDERLRTLDARTHRLEVDSARGASPTPRK